jgi:hypothetical protein
LPKKLGIAMPRSSVMALVEIGTPTCWPDGVVSVVVEITEYHRGADGAADAGSRRETPNQSGRLTRRRRLRVHVGHARADGNASGEQQHQRHTGKDLQGSRLSIGMSMRARVPEIGDAWRRLGVSRPHHRPGVS